jgi:thiamine biosynthesis lipoprotein
MGERFARREALALGIGALVVAAVPFAVSRRRRIVRRRIPVMGTVAEVAVVAADEAPAQAAIDAAFAELRRIEALMTAHDDASDVGRANLAADGVSVSPETALVVEEALRWSEATDGAFDPCIGGAVRLWDVQHRSEPPADALVGRFASRGLWRKLDVASFRGLPALRLHDDDARLDLGGIAKGWAVDRAAQALRDRGFRDGLVNVGGDLVAMGESASGGPWRVGVQSPDDPDVCVATIDASDTAIATSGDYVRFFQWHGRRYHHLIDPGTGAPRLTPVHSLTIEAPTCFAADAAATAVYGAPSDVAARVLGVRAPGARVVHSI